MPKVKNGVSVRILHDGGVGGYKKGEVVENAHDGLIHIATNKICNAADGELLAELLGEVKAVEDGGKDAVQSEDSQS